MPLEITYAPSRINLHEAAAVIERARGLGAFRFNTGRLMRIGTAARHWGKLDASDADWNAFRAMLAREAKRPGMELCHEPFSMDEGLRRSAGEPPATLLVLPNGWVKVAAALPHVCADLRHGTIGQAWEAYRSAWRGDTMAAAVNDAIADERRHGDANAWRLVPVNT
jgi:MoaA/NifB/PqqE/SkfB family radical SAM enzyme